MRAVQILKAAFAASIFPLAAAAGDLVNVNVNGFSKHVPPPGPVQAGALVDKCGGWVEAVAGTTCYDLAQSIGIDVNRLKTLNPQLKGGCSENLWAGYYYCKGLVQTHHKITKAPLPGPKKTPDADCTGAFLDKCASAVFAASETPGPMIDWCERYLDGPKCTEARPEGLLKSYDKFPKVAMASSLCAYPSAPPMAPRFSTACRCFSQIWPRPT
ncbi:hypothetical protein F4802DRAFT_600270 [Xylaria palmicola]|nr:hypothetical protein F4802DRAFT_600270 [Xylaria palmicola]